MLLRFCFEMWLELCLQSLLPVWLQFFRPHIGQIESVFWAKIFQVRTSSFLENFCKKSVLASAKWFFGISEAMSWCLRNLWFRLGRHQKLNGCAEKLSYLTCWLKFSNKPIFSVHSFEWIAWRLWEKKFTSMTSKEQNLTQTPSSTFFAKQKNNRRAKWAIGTIPTVSSFFSGWFRGRCRGLLRFPTGLCLHWTRSSYFSNSPFGIQNPSISAFNSHN